MLVFNGFIFPKVRGKNTKMFEVSPPSYGKCRYIYQSRGSVMGFGRSHPSIATRARHAAKNFQRNVILQRQHDDLSVVRKLWFQPIPPPNASPPGNMGLIKPY